MSISSILTSATFNDVTTSGPGTCQTEHTSHGMRVVLSHSKTKTPPPQMLCSSSTAEMTYRCCDFKRTWQVTDVMCLASLSPKAENTSNMSRWLLVKTLSEVWGVVQLVTARSESLVWSLWSTSWPLCDSEINWFVSWVVDCSSLPVTDWGPSNSSMKRKSAKLFLLIMDNIAKTAEKRGQVVNYTETALWCPFLFL